MIGFKIASFQTMIGVLLAKFQWIFATTAFFDKKWGSAKSFSPFPAVYFAADWNFL